MVIVFKNNAQSHDLGLWLWLSESLGQAKANSRPTLLAWLGFWPEAKPCTSLLGCVAVTDDNRDVEVIGVIYYLSMSLSQIRISLHSEITVRIKPSPDSTQ